MSRGAIDPMKTFPFKLDWFAPAPAQRLAALRICLGAYSLWYLVPRVSDYLAFATSDTHLFAPVGVARLLEAPMPADCFRLLLYALLASNLAFVLGWRHRITGPLFSLLLLAP